MSTTTAGATEPTGSGDGGRAGDGRDERGRDSLSDDEDLHDDEEMGLTDPDRRRRQKKRRRNTLLDQRIVREKNLSVEERKEADKSVMRRLLINALLIFLWYFFSLSISLVSLLTYSPAHFYTCLSPHIPIHKVTTAWYPYALYSSFC